MGHLDPIPKSVNHAIAKAVQAGRMSGRLLIRRDSLLQLDDSSAIKQALSQALKKKSSQSVCIEAIEEGDDLGTSFKNIEDHLFDKLSEGTGKVYLSRFLVSLEYQGLLRDDPRLKETMRRLKEVQKKLATKGKDVALDRENFKWCIIPNVVLIKKALDGDQIIPDFFSFSNTIKVIYTECKTNTGGKVASYIPQLARFDPNYWGVSVCTVDGQRFSEGDTKVKFCLQSTCKPLNYAIALTDTEESENVHDFVGQEPSGVSFNEIKLNNNKQPHNPMINAGAIVVCSLLRNKKTQADRYDYVSQTYKKMAGGEFIGFNNSVYLSERETADRNFALGYYMQENHCFPEGIKLKETLDFYFQLCSVEVTCESAAVIAGTLANGGICPLTGEEVLHPEAVRDCLSLMHSCGMYDYSGQFAFEVGLPAKSGVSGIVLLVIPNVAGFCLWSPPLDSCGNSVRAIQFCDMLVGKFNFHHFDYQRTRTNKKSDPRRRQQKSKDRVYYTCIYAASTGNLKELQRLYVSGLDMGVADYDGRTALHLAAAEGHVECCKFLIQICDVDMDPKDRWDRTPLMEAIKNNHPDVVEFLQSASK